MEHSLYKLSTVSVLFWKGDNLLTSILIEFVANIFQTSINLRIVSNMYGIGYHSITSRNDYRYRYETKDGLQSNNKIDYFYSLSHSHQLTITNLKHICQTFLKFNSHNF